MHQHHTDHKPKGLTVSMVLLILAQKMSTNHEQEFVEVICPLALSMISTRMWRCQNVFPNNMNICRQY